MRTRETSYWDYGISVSESKELIETCRNADKKTELFAYSAETGKTIQEKVIVLPMNGLKPGKIPV